jgi:lipoate-protein ligase A
LQRWRFIPLLETSGRLQMAIDAWLLDQHHQGQQPSVLRFYHWNPAAISLGYHQRRCPAHWQHLTWQGSPIDLVRRPTGGRAVLHCGDLTYAVITSGLTGNRMQVYRMLCEFLIHGWRSIGVDLVYGTAGSGYIHNPNCFGTATGADLVTSEGAKLIGSAQLYRGKAVLQHGSMPVQIDRALFQQVFGIEPMLPQLPTEQIDSIVSALTAAAQNCFDAEFEVQPLTPSEWTAVQALANQNSLDLLHRG